MKQMFSVVLAFLIPITCFGQVSLKASAGDKVIGWLLYRENTDSGGFNYIVTPDGYLLYLDIPEGHLKHWSGGLYFADENCEGQAYASKVHTNDYYGEILYTGATDNPDTRFVRAGHTAAWIYQVLPYYIHSSTGDCVGPVSYETSAVPVEFVNPLDYGIQFLDGEWKVPIDSVAVDQSDAMFCNGFEGCPAGPQGYTSLIRQTPEVGSACDAFGNGGIRIDSGVDTSQDGVLDPEEVTSTSYICNGASQ